MSDRSFKTRSVASVSSRSSAVRRRAELAELRLAQRRDESNLERQMEQQQAEMEQQQAEMEQQRAEMERQRAEMERQRAELSIAHEAEQLQLEAKLIEAEEAGDVEPVHIAGSDSRAPSRVTAGSQPAVGPAIQPRYNGAAVAATDRTGRWVDDQAGRAPSPERISTGSWIDHLPTLREAGQADRMCATAAPSPLPRLSLEMFRGDPLHWPRWSALFKALVHDRRELSDAERLTHLQTCLEGPARDAVSGLMCDGALYGEALRELQQQFGDPSAVVKSSLLKVLGLPAVKDHNFSALSELSRALHAAVSVLKSQGHHADLAATVNVSAVVAKLPPAVTWRWGEQVVTLKPAQPTLADLDTWLRGQVSAARAVQGLASDWKWDSGRRHEKDSPRGDSGRRRDGNQRGGASGVPKSHSVEISAVTTAPPERCGHCDGGHGLGACDGFSRLSAAGRMQVAVRSRACFRCLEVGHLARACKLKLKCSIDNCGRLHHQLLHGAPGPDTAPTVGAAAAPAPDRPHVGVASAAEVGVASAAGKAQVLLQVVPVSVHGPRGHRRVNALLDLGSQISLVTESLASQLGLTGPVQHLRISTVDRTETRPSRRVQFGIQSLASNELFQVVDAQTTPVLNVSGQAVDWPVEKLKWPHLADLSLSEATSEEIDVLLGTDVFGLIVPREVREGPAGSPSAVHTRLGWIATDRLPAVYRHDDAVLHVNHVRAPSDDALQQQVEQFWTTESFGTKYIVPPRKSKEDERALEMLETSTVLRGGHYQTGLLWKRPDLELPDNRAAALTRLRHTERKLDRDKQLARAYKDTIEGYVREGYARKVSPHDPPVTSRREWYLPHHGVIGSKKPGKLRVVFDAAARCRGTSLNENLLTGPDLANSLIGVLLRFRQRPFPISADIRAMYHQVRVAESDQPALRFLWRGADRAREPDVYQMQVHVFGAASSSCAANYALRKCATDNISEFPEAAAAVHSRFYVDDYLDSLETVEDADRLQSSLTDLLERGGFHLTKWVAPHKQENDPDQRDLDLDDAPVERALGVHWDVARDTFVFKVTELDKECTKRGILSRVSSIFDPLGMLAPYVLRAKGLLQRLWMQGYEWDQKIDNEELVNAWNEWLDELNDLDSFSMGRCHRPTTASPVDCQRYRPTAAPPVDCQLHVFCDASMAGFGAVAYFRLQLEGGRVWCSFVMAKCRVAPLRQMSIPRLELQAAVMAVRLADLLRREHDITIDSVQYWSDSRTVLQWIGSESRRFHTFVANRVAEIQDASNVSCWRHVPGIMNPADAVSRGGSAASLCDDSSVWLRGPDFLWRSPDEWPAQPEANEENCTEDRRAVMVTVAPESSIDPADYSSWLRLLRVTSWVRRFVRNCLAPIASRDRGALSVSELRDAEKTWLRRAQRDDFSPELDALRRPEPLPRRSRLLPLSPYLDGDGLLRVGGRLERAPLPYESRHQVLLSPSHDVTRLIVADKHRRLSHSGPDHVLCALRQRYWILRGRSAVKKWTAACLYCKRRRAVPRPPVMADLPAGRVTTGGPPFSRVGVDYFGPITVKRLRKTEKRYGCLFTCLATRAVHIEIAHSLDADSLVMAVRRMIARRGRPRQVYSDNGTNLRAGERELRMCLRELNEGQVSDALTQEEIDWRFSPPASPHFGGIWERLVRSAKRALHAVVGHHTVTDEMLLTVMAEVEGLLNSRPLTHVSADPDDLQALTPNHFLIGCASPNLPPGIFEDRDLCSRRRWRHSQRVVDHFWRRWRREYLPGLTVRRKWTQETRPLQAGDLVLIMEDNEPRGHWPLARIVRPIPGADGRVRAAEVKTSGGVYTRPTARLCLLEEA